jgi:hypothetical protein
LTAQKKEFLIDNANKINQHAKTMAAKLHRPFQYLTVPTRAVTVAAKLREAGINSPTPQQEYPPSGGGSAEESEQKPELAGSTDSRTSQVRVSGNS